jgi:Zn-dependent membrane protease YugP
VVWDSRALAAVAFGLFAFTTASSLVTVWVEVDASRRALRELRSLGARGLDARGARRVLLACGATYVADTLVDLGFIGRRLRRDGDGAGGDDADGGWGGGGFD